MIICIIQEEEKKRQKEKERVTLEKRYAMPDDPCIIIHPSATAKGGKFDCTIMSLSLLLDYRPEDNKEHSFEVGIYLYVVLYLLEILFVDVICF